MVSKSLVSISRHLFFISMKLRYLLFILILSLAASGCKQEPEPTPNPNPTPTISPKEVEKTNDMKLYMHYMPWFNTQEFSGYWGFHWTMANQDPNVILQNGNRQIATHYYPLIGPYDSSDPDVIEYHLLLMKLAGIDGLLIDWYGSHEVADYGINLGHTNELIEGIKRVGLDFAVVYEEFTAENVADETSLSDIQAAQQDMNYAAQNYFSADEYISLEGRPLMLTFGPRYFRDPAQWGQILSFITNKPSFFPLWNTTSQVGEANVTGEFSWVDFTPGLNDLNFYYQSSASANRTIIGSAYPGFHDFYQEGGVGTSYGFVDPAGNTLDRTLQMAEDAELPYLQLVTWNDFGEGTMFEPTQEFGYTFLEKLQSFAGVSYAKADLELVHTYYLKRKELANDGAAQATLDDVFDAFIQLELDTAANLLDTL